MYIMKETDSLKIANLMLPLYDSLGVEIDGSLYSVTEGRTLAGVVVEPFEFTCDDNLAVADNIFIGSTTEELLPNTITNIGNKYRVAKKIEQTLNTDIIIKENFQTFETIALPEGIYYFANNEALLISRNFSNVRVSFTEVNARYDELSSNVDLEAKNNEAIKSVIADFSFKPNLFRALDLNQVRELVILKILMWLTQGTEQYGEAKEEYNNYKKDVISLITVEPDGVLDTPEAIDDGSSGDYWKWHPRA